MSNNVNDEHLELIGATINEIIGIRNRFADYIAKYEVWDFLTVGEAQFMNDISTACQKFLDTPKPKKED